MGLCSGLVWRRACDVFVWLIYMVTCVLYGTCVMACVVRLRSTCSEVRDDLGGGLCDGVHKKGVCGGECVRWRVCAAASVRCVCVAHLYGACAMTCMNKRV